MTAVPSFAYATMDLLHPEDTMDLASSPRMPGDDLELPYELDTMRDASAEPNQEEMIEDPINPDQHSTEDVQLVEEDLLDDEDMVDEDTVVQNTHANQEDFTMETHQQILLTTEPDEDDILYDDDELVREGSGEARDTHDVEIVDEEDLFREEEGLDEHSPGDTSHTPRVLHNNQEEEILDQVQSTNMTTQDAEDPGATQGLQFSGDSANISDHDVQYQTNSEYDINHNPTNETTTYTAFATETVNNSSTEGPTDIGTDPQSLDLLGSAKIGEAGPSAVDVNSSSSHVETSDYPHQEIESTQRPDGEPLLQGTEAEDGHFVNHQTHATPLHTVKVNYQDTEICLFPPNEDDDSETFFLAEIDLAYQSLDKLLTACHDVLAGTIGDDDELVLDIPSLGLHISQDSSHATQISLSQILDVYLALSHNAQPESVEPLYCHLSSRVSLASQHAYLLSAAEQGKTFADIAAEYLRSHEGSLDAEEEVDGFNESHEESQENLGQEDIAENADPEHTNWKQDHNDTATEEPNLEVVHQHIDSHAREGALDNDFPNEDASNSDALESILETDGDGVTGIRENETSTTSTVRGDEQEPEGEYDPLSVICYAHGLSCCFDCDANMYADFENSHNDIPESVNVASIPRGYLEDTGEVVVSSNDTAGDEDGKAETQSAVGDTESSRTLEAGDDAFDQNLHGDAEGEREGLLDNREDFHDSLDGGEPLDHRNELSNTNMQEEANIKSSHLENLHDYDEDFQPVPQAVHDSAIVTHYAGTSSEFDEDDLLDVHGEQEGDGPLEQASPLDSANGTAGNEASAQVHVHEDLFKVSRSNGTDYKADGELSAAREQADLLLGDDDAKASVNEVTPPATPSNSNTSKRKIRDDEDDFDLLDSGTPDIKRRRPS